MNNVNGDTIPIIIAKGVHKWFGDFHALKGIDLEVQKGEVVVSLVLRVQENRHSSARSTAWRSTKMD